MRVEGTENWPEKALFDIHRAIFKLRTDLDFSRENLSLSEERKATPRKEMTVLLMAGTKLIKSLDRQMTNTVTTYLQYMLNAGIIDEVIEENDITGDGAYVYDLKLDREFRTKNMDVSTALLLYETEKDDPPTCQTDQNLENWR